MVYDRDGNPSTALYAVGTPGTYELALTYQFAAPHLAADVYAARTSPATARFEVAP